MNSPLTRIGVVLYFAFIPLLLLYDIRFGPWHKTVSYFYAYVPAVLAYDALIRVGLGFMSISEFFWTSRTRRIASCVYAVAGACVLVASVPQWPTGTTLYAIVVSGLLVAHLGFEVFPGLKGIL